MTSSDFCVRKMAHGGRSRGRWGDLIGGGTIAAQGQAEVSKVGINGMMTE